MGTAPATDSIKNEVRFATVMYGGVSLAIYINGISQELLRLVRASASAPSPTGTGVPNSAPIATAAAVPADARALLAEEQLDGTERVYRRIAQLLGPNDDWDPTQVGQIDAAEPLRSRFIVDILSGTSAGGINSVFLAKALATGESIDVLAKLWLERAAIETLVNDEKSRFDAFPGRELPASLLNSRRMYRELIEAFDAMDDVKERPPRAKRDTPNPPSLVHEVDLFVTATDIAGLPIALKLEDRLVTERRHRNVFHLRFSDGRTRNACNDFTRDKNPFLAFIARCTSAFPFAFEPMRLKDIDSVLPYRANRSAPPPVAEDGNPWRHFFPAYTGTSDAPGGVNEAEAVAAAERTAEPWLREGGALAARAFGDGGYLDNKPFEYAISAIAARRNPGVVLDRKLLYLEPAPEHPELENVSDEPPNVVTNVAAALSLARYETIRSDLQRVLDRNRLVERVARIVRGVDEDIRIGDRAGAKLVRDKDATGYSQSDLVDMIRTHGIAYGGYHRLKVSALVDDIAEYLSRVAGYQDNTDEFQAVRLLVAAWRDLFFAPNFADRTDAMPETQRAERSAQPLTPDGTLGVVRTENLFLLRYDLSYRIRRLNFVLDRLEQLICADSVAEQMLKQRGFEAAFTDVAFRDAFTQTLRSLRDKLAPVQASLRARQECLLSRDHNNPLSERIKLLRVSRFDMLRILKPRSPELRRRVARDWIREDSHCEALREIAEALVNAVLAVTVPAASTCETFLPYPPILEPRPGDGADLARTVARHYYHGYDRYDQLIFPAFFATDVGGESDIVDVARLSPEDATSLIEEGYGDSRRKLAGNALGHFGAFLDRRWRWNDMMWGRLDAAERLIQILLPCDDDVSVAARQTLIDEAHGSILEEEFDKREAEPMTWATEADREVLRSLLALRRSNANEAERRTLREQFRKAFSARYWLDNKVTGLEPQFVSGLLARSTRVIGQMLKRLKEEYSFLEKPAAILVGAGSIAWGLVEAATPQSFWSWIAWHWLKLIWLFDALLLGASLFIRELRSFALELCGATLVMQLALSALRDLFGHKTSLWKRVLLIVGAAVFCAFALGASVLASARLRTVLWNAIELNTDIHSLVLGLAIAGGVSLLLTVAAFVQRRTRSAPNDTARPRRREFQ